MFIVAPCVGATLATAFLQRNFALSSHVKGVLHFVHGIDALRQPLDTVREQRYSRSRLNCYRAELIVLDDEGASLRDLAAWLRQYKRVKEHPTTIARRLAH